ncbi:hypothetical protein MIR68_008910 [Amoeboaphelidium protococcarum]|nr:hypothetical protein MIR68_012089 [Amoeboaphelidium protococcarum]KAI3632835.1 hypothetical protein MIR68_008910 [Amoeboaphelidium protococcarum]KAI3648277.1 hypothetical protein MP228_006131 [Amoeboaphelidium protococcarum]KAI3649628.1 hypothetical protein MP228_005260 [Amoeboaphelidium protococcarum]
MSWQTYVDQNLVGTKKIAKGAIHGLDGNPWATSAGLALKPQEVQELIKGFKDANALRASGLKLNAVKYIVIRADDRSIYGKQGTGGVVCVKTKSAVLIGFYDESAQPGEATKVVEQLADYLISVNY